jgi:FdhD protein
MKPDDAIFSSGGALRLPVQGVRHGRAYAARDWVADEVPVAMEYNGISHAVMLATPLDLVDFALGFALAEGIALQRAEVYGIEVMPADAGITVQLELASAAFARLKSRRRSLAGRTGCGVCGTESLDSLARALPQLEGGPSFAPAALTRAMAELGASQTLQAVTGAVHAAAWCTADGELRLLREDIGRHNALDKLIGALAAADGPGGIHAAEGFIVVTSRASFEMVQKAAVAGVRLLAAVSAPTTLAVATAERCGLSLAGFVREADFALYTHPHRLR